MISSSREAKQEGETNDGNGNGNGGDRKLSKGPSSSSSTPRQWSSSGFRNPRIVRVSRSFGGKDRHSKVCTIRGIRDRRIRLSVPTAIQLYDLQERLGVGQPSKVVDWLLEATKDDIDKLPPLQMPLGFNQFHQPLFPHEPNQNPNPPFFDLNPNSDERDKGKWIKENDQDHDGNNIEDHHQRLFPLNNQSQFNGLLNNGMSMNSYNYHWDPSNLSLSQFGNNHGLMAPPRTENFFNGSTMNVPPPSTVPSMFFPTTYPPDGNDSRQLNYLQLLSSNYLSNSVAMRPFSLNVNAGLTHTQNDDENRGGDDRDDTDS